jgi:SAM-dependent methyltransferase
MIRAALARRLEAAAAAVDLGLSPAEQALVLAEGLLSRPFVSLHLISETYTARLALLLALDLGWESRLRAGATLEELLVGFHSQSRLPATWMLAFLTEEGCLEHRDERWYLHELPALENDLATLRELAEAEAPGHLQNLELLDAVRQKVPPYFTKGRRGEELLFDLGTYPLWLDYFRNENLIYRTNNLFAFAALQSGLHKGCRILELGGGAGSFAQFLARKGGEMGLLESIAEYRFTDVAPAFLRRAQRGLKELAPGLPLTFARVDLNKPLDDQGFKAETFDAILGVNVLHVAKDLQATLRDLRGHLAPGGRLVLGECLKADLARPIYLEFAFQFMSGFTDVLLDAELRPTCGFLTPEAWVKALRAAGYREVMEMPKVRAIMDRWEFFNVGAFSATV